MKKHVSSFDLRDRLNEKRGISTPPQVCAVCRRVSFLKCMDCDTIYCSATCQIKDWDKHQMTHHDNFPMGPSSSVTPRSSRSTPLAATRPAMSVQGRLQVAVNKPVSDVFYQKIGISGEAKKENTAPPDDQHMPKLVQQQMQPGTLRVTTSEASDKFKNQSPHSTPDQPLIKFEKAPAVFIKPEKAPTATENLIEQAIRKMSSNRMFKRYVKFQTDRMDKNGFSFVIISAIDHNDSGVVFWVQPYEFNQMYGNYKKSLNDFYSGEHLPVIEFNQVSKFKSHMVMAMINGAWCRAQITSITEPDVVGLEDIDSGMKTIATSRNQLKIPGDSEINKPAFAFKIIFENLENTDSMYVGDIVKLRVTHLNQFGASMGEVELKKEDQDDAVDDKVEPNTERVELVKPESQVKPTGNVKNPEPPVNVQPVGLPVNVKKVELPVNVNTAELSEKKRCHLKQLQVKNPRVGPAIKLVFCDGSRLASGKMHVFESTPENFNFYDKLTEEIDAFVKTNESEPDYQPKVQELVLAKFIDDDSFYRAVCISTSEDSVKVCFIDYGNACVVNVKDVIPMPPELLHDGCSLPVLVKIASGRPISDIDAEKTKDFLLKLSEFTAKVEKVPVGAAGPDQFVVTLDDSLIKFK